MKMEIKIEVHVPEKYREQETHFISEVIRIFREMYAEYEMDYRPDGTPQVTVSYWNEDGTPYDLSYKGPTHESD